MNYLKLLEHSYKTTTEYDMFMFGSRLEYLGELIFDFTTYDDYHAVFFAKKAVEVCEAINNRTTFDYIECPTNHTWFLLMCNMPWFQNKITWGTSIRGAFWECDIVLKTCGLYNNDEQILELDFDLDSWKTFINDLIVFSKLDEEAGL